MLDIQEKKFNNIKYTKGAKTRILLEEKVSQEQIDKLRRFFKKYEGILIDYQEFEKLYSQYGGSMDEFSFC